MSAIFWHAVAFIRNDCGNEVLEYALVLSLFALLSIVTVRLMAVTANARVETDQSNYTNAFVNGY